jgi:hypothetical protein
MGPNPLLRRLGLSNQDRVAVLHADDVGMCHASLEAFRRLDGFGLVACGAVMMPCPWARATADFARSHPGADLGVHLTLTSEWEAYRWGPVSTRDPGSGLMDGEGFLPRTSEELQESASPAAVKAELEAQVQLALQFGIDVSHVDTHMGTVVYPKFLQIYLEMGVRNRIPGMYLRLNTPQLQARGLSQEAAEVATRMMGELEANGYPLLDNLLGLDLGKPEERLEQAKRAFSSLKPGLTHFIIHPAVDTPELREIAPDWRARVADYETFMREDLRAYIREIGVSVIGYRALRDLIRAT